MSKELEKELYKQDIIKNFFNNNKIDILNYKNLKLNFFVDNDKNEYKELFQSMIEIKKNEEIKNIYFNISRYLDNNLKYEISAFWDCGEDLEAINKRYEKHLFNASFYGSELKHKKHSKNINFENLEISEEIKKFIIFISFNKNNLRFEERDFVFLEDIDKEKYKNWVEEAKAIIEMEIERERD